MNIFEFVNIFLAWEHVLKIHKKVQKCLSFNIILNVKISPKQDYFSNLEHFSKIPFSF